jgi:hypothetical protein
MQSLYHNLPLINGLAQKDGEKFKAKNSAFTSDRNKASFTTDIAGAYPAEANVKSWLRTYTLLRGKSFKISDKYELGKNEGITSSNLMTSCTVKKVSLGVLLFEGDGFNLNMSYNPKVVNPEIEFIEVKDSVLRRYWPKGVSRIVLKFIKPGVKGSNEVIFTVVK